MIIAQQDKINWIGLYQYWLKCSKDTQGSIKKLFTPEVWNAIGLAYDDYEQGQFDINDKIRVN